MNKIDRFLKDALVKDSSDLHFISGDPPRVRVHGSLSTLSNEALTIDFVKECMYEIMTGTTQRDFEANDAVDFAYEIPDVSRFRVNVMRHLNGIGAVFRAIPSKAKSTASFASKSLWVVPVLEDDTSATSVNLETDGTLDR